MGDGYGGSEIKLRGGFTKQECIDKVRLQYPKANGAKMSRMWPTHYFGLCYAEFGMKGWGRGIEQPLTLFKDNSLSQFYCPGLFSLFHTHT